MIRVLLGVCLLLSPLAATAEDLLSFSRQRDGEIAAAAPRLAAFLDAEAADLRFQAEDQARIAAEQARAAGAPFRTHVLTLDERAHFVGGGLVSVLRTARRDQGGAHGGLWFDAVLWDARAGDIAGLDRIFPPTREGALALERLVMALKADLLARPGLWRKSIAMATVVDPAALQFFTLVPSTSRGRIGGIAFHFAPYEIGPYAAGPQVAVIPQTIFAGGVAPDLAPLFAGAPAR